MLILKITDNNGMYGWGEVWCNSLTGAEHRAKLIDNVLNLYSQILTLLLLRKHTNT